MCENALCRRGADCDFLHLKSAEAASAAVLLKDGSSVLVADLAPTLGLVCALLTPRQAHMCQSALCPHGVDCTFLHPKEQPGSAATAGAKLQLKDGTSVLVADLAPTQGISFALMTPASLRCA
jgi:hypothetical protein